MTDLQQLLDSMASDAMALREVEMPTEEVVFFKGVIEAYPGIAAVHATRGAARLATARLYVATTRELAHEVDDLLEDLVATIEGLTWKVLPQASV